jgi:putative spermidine/putrescine transport system ATP-binding protein
VVSAPTQQPGAPAVTFAGVSRHFGGVKAVDDVSFSVVDGEFFTFLGPSGSGKTTCLRLIAGFERPDAGTVSLSGAVANYLPPFERDVHTVFQDYALFPHMNVRDNVAYGLMVRGVDRRARHRQADEALAMVRLDGLGARRPAQLSGGQRQRVALARALVGRPKMLLLDEPLGALDLKLREQMQIELKALQHQVGITFVYVTHDQQEALSMSDRIAVFNHGRIDQLGSPAEVYDHPTTVFVAGFVGASNLVEGALARRLTGRDGPFMVRPERVRLGADPGAGADHGLRARAGADTAHADTAHADTAHADTAHADTAHADTAHARGRIAELAFLGMHTRYHVQTDEGARLIVDVQNHEGRGSAPGLVHGAPVALSWSLEHMQPLER